MIGPYQRTQPEPLSLLVNALSFLTRSRNKEACHDGHRHSRTDLLARRASSVVVVGEVSQYRLL
jgi:hypothetical protein